MDKKSIKIFKIIIIVIVLALILYWLSTAGVAVRSLAIFGVTSIGLYLLIVVAILVILGFILYKKKYEKKKLSK